MNRRASIIMLLWATTLVGCNYKCIVQNTDPFAEPVVLTWNENPTNGQPNPGQLEAGFQAEFEFGKPAITLDAVDPNNPEFFDEISLTLANGETRVIEWDGFQLIDRGNQRLSLSLIASLLFGEATIISEPSGGDAQPNPEKAAAAN